MFSVYIICKIIILNYYKTLKVKYYYHQEHLVILLSEPELSGIQDYTDNNSYITAQEPLHHIRLILTQTSYPENPGSDKFKNPTQII